MHSYVFAVVAAAVLAVAVHTAASNRVDPPMPISPRPPVDSFTPTVPTLPAAEAEAVHSQALFPVGDNGLYTLSAVDRAFVQQAALSGYAEVTLGKLALRRGGQPEVKQFAQRMINEHMTANNQLRTLAEAKNIILPTDLDTHYQSQVRRLARLSGTTFDREYIRVQVAEHVTATALFRQERATGTDDQLRNWADRTLPALQHHLRMARDLGVGKPVS
jgi:putative membrane protein